MSKNATHRALGYFRRIAGSTKALNVAAAARAEATEARAEAAEARAEATEARAEAAEARTAAANAISMLACCRDELAALRLSNIETNQYIIARLIRAERRGSENPLRVLFLVPHVSLFDAYAPIYSAMEADPAFIPEVLAFRRADIDPDVGADATNSFFHELGITAHVVGFDPDLPPPAIDQDSYDILFYMLGSAAYPEPYRIENTSLRFLTCYLSYGVLLADHPEFQFNSSFHHAAWRIFANTQRERRLYDRYCRRTRGNAINTGYPKFDLYQTTASQQSASPTLIWAPHWAIGRISMNFGCFDRVCFEMLSVIDEFPQVDFVYRPHPNLKHALAAIGAMTSENYALYLKELEARPNVRIHQSGGNIALFCRSAGMITDSVSFLAEYLPTGRPLLFLERSDRDRLNEDGERIIALHYRGDDSASIRRFVREVVLGGEDVRRIEREAAWPNLLSINPRGASAAIIRELRDTLLAEPGCGPRRTLSDIAARSTSDRRIRAQELSDSFWLRQEKFDYASQFPERHRNQIAFTEKHLLPRLSADNRVLDIGCADAWHSCLVARACGWLDGFDLNPRFVTLARRTAAETGLTNCRFEVANALNLRPEPGSYEVVMLCGLTTYLIDDASAKKVMAIAAASLRDGGLLLLKDSLHCNLGDRVNIQEGSSAKYRDLAHYQAMVAGAGFAICADEWLETQIAVSWSKDYFGSYMALAVKENIRA